jgi:plastocyanin
MKKRRWAFTALFVLVGAALIVPAVVLAGPGSSATVQYGKPNTGTSFEPGEHDSSFRAYDKLNPRTVKISAGGSVNFELVGFPHQVAVYNLGVGPEDVQVPPFGPPDDPNFENLFINADSTGLKFLGASPFGPPQGTETVTFAAPGKYLMICNFTPHFAFAKMYGWVDVK